MYQAKQVAKVSRSSAVIDTDCGAIINFHLVDKYFKLVEPDTAWVF